MLTAVPARLGTFDPSIILNLGWIASLKALYYWHSWSCVLPSDWSRVRGLFYWLSLRIRLPVFVSNRIFRLRRGGVALPSHRGIPGPAGSQEVRQQPSEGRLHPTHRQQDHLLRTVLLRVRRPQRLWELWVAAEGWNHFSSLLLRSSRQNILRSRNLY